MINQSFYLKLQKSILKSSFHEFFKWSFTVLLPNDKLEDNFHIKYICDLLQEEQFRIERKEEKDKDIIVNIPPRSTKTLIVSVAFPVWVWIRDPRARFITVSFDDTLSLKNAQDSRDLINSNEFQVLFNDIFKLRNDANAKGFYFNNLGGYRLSKTVGSNITGHSGLYLIVDDPQNPKTSDSEVERLNVINYWDQALYNRCTPIDLGLRVILMQRLHTKDLTGYLLEKSPGDYTHINLPAEESNKIKPEYLKEKYVDGLLDPIRLSRKVLGKFKTTLGSRGYSSQYKQLPVDGEGNIFKRSWFEVISADQIERDLLNEPIMFTIDTAYTEKKENDPSGILTFFIKNNCLYILDFKSKRLELPALIKWIIDYTQMAGYSNNSIIGVEPKASGKSVVQVIKADTMLNIIETKPPDADKVARAYSITPTCEARRVKLVSGNYVEDFLDKITGFPKVTEKEAVDVLEIAVNQFLLDSNPAIIWA